MSDNPPTHERWAPPVLHRPRGMTRRITTVVSAVLWVCVVLDLIAAVSIALLTFGFHRWWNGLGTPDERSRAQAWADAEALAGRTISLAAVAFLVGIVALMVWMVAASTAIERRRPAGRSWTRGWAIGSWLIPVANAVIPKLVINEIERIAVTPMDQYGQVRPDWRSRRPSTSGRIWWAAWIVAAIASSIASTLITDWELTSTTAAPMYIGYLMLMAALVLWAVSHVACIRTLRGMSAHLTP